MTQYLLAIDQGTTNSRAHIFNDAGKLLSSQQMNLTQIYPQSGWAEQNPEEMWRNTLTCCQQALAANQLRADQIAAIGITNQRETTIIWDKKTGKAIYPAIVWHDRRTAEFCQHMRTPTLDKQLQEKTGLLLDPYFSASKISWILNHVPGARLRAEQGELLFGTVDTYLLWRLTQGSVHATDATNASRTLLFNIRTQQWDVDILKLFHIPAIMLPSVLDSSTHFGYVDKSWLGHPIPITSMIGDQQAATVGQACFQPGMAKITYGTGAFVLVNTGQQIVQSQQRLLATISYRLNGVATYGLEGSIFSAGIIIKWLRDKLRLIQTAAESEILAQSVANTGDVFLIPAFTGLGAPHWNPHARAAILGLNADTNAAQIVRAGLEAVAYQSRDLLHAIHCDYPAPLTCLRVDGGMAANSWLLQFIANILQTKIAKPACIETTALGAAFLAGLQIGIYKSLDDIAKLWKLDRAFTPQIEISVANQLHANWKKALQRVLTS